MAQVEVLKDAANAAYCKWRSSSDELGGMQKLMQAVEAIPEQCLREIQEKALQDLYKFGFTPEQYHAFKHSKDGLALQAEAGRAGYLHGHLDALGDPDEMDKEHSEFRSKQYANRIRQGGE